MVIRDPKTGEAVLWRFDHSVGKDKPVMYTCGDYHHVDEDTDQQDSHLTLQERIDQTEMVECPKCDGDGEKRTADGEDIETCTRCYGSGTIYEEEVIE